MIALNEFKPGEMFFFVVLTTVKDTPDLTGFNRHGLLWAPVAFHVVSKPGENGVVMVRDYSRDGNPVLPVFVRHALKTFQESEIAAEKLNTLMGKKKLSPAKQAEYLDDYLAG